MPTKQHERTVARCSALQILYTAEIKGENPSDVLDGGLCLVEDYPLSDYALDLVKGTEKHLDFIDDQLKLTSENWALDRMPVVDRVILRLAVYEMAYVGNVPIPVAINEAVELAREFGGEEDSPRFVNGVLGRIASRLEAGRRDDDGLGDGVGAGEDNRGGAGSGVGGDDDGGAGDGGDGGCDAGDGCRGDDGAGSGVGGDDDGVGAGEDNRGGAGSGAGEDNRGGAGSGVGNRDGAGDDVEGREGVDESAAQTQPGKKITGCNADSHAQPGKKITGCNADSHAQAGKKITGCNADSHAQVGREVVS